MPGKINLKDLDPATVKKLKLEQKTVQPKLIALGKVLQCLDELTTRDAMWVLRSSINLIQGFTRRGTRA